MMIEHDAPILILGSGFAGSLCALLLGRIGLRSVMVDRAAHPRFAIGESSTPTTDRVLADLAHRYDLPRIAPLARYGPWKRTYPEIPCGPKRGFSYFSQPPGERFRPGVAHANELLVAASSDDESADTHWFRAEVDRFFADEAVQAGAVLLDRTEIAVIQQNGGWTLTGERLGESVRVRGEFVLDATGDGAVLPRTLGIENRVDRLRTNSRGLFSHFANLPRWHDVLTAKGVAVEDHPFCCDRAALHHVTDIAWMWVLRFDHGITSAGFAIDGRACPLDERVSPDDEWQALLAAYPGVAEQFTGSDIAHVPGRMIRTRRMQRRLARAVGDGWALLPHTAGFIDPLYSTGIAHSLCGIERLIRIFEEHWGRSTLRAALGEYESALFTELELVDRIVHCGYLGFADFRAFAAASMLYFAGATTYERQRAAEGEAFRGGFLCAHRDEFRAAVYSLHERLEQQARGGRLAPGDAADFEQAVAREMAPFNMAGLCDPGCQNMYAYTVKPL
ncbi:MAG TPA: tryptophan 7-halogenase [Planctomycetaceae bacterium]|nr:tryptophan 7-halogenase [Planctomycetaceae bacterium]